MERLKERLENFKKGTNEMLDNKTVQVSKKFCEQVVFYLEKLKEYEDLEEQGRLIKLPCKIGDVVAIVLMIPSNERKTVIQAEVKEINVGKYLARIGTQIKVEPIANRGTRYKYYVSEWGTYVFSTLAEAEKALEEMEK